MHFYLILTRPYATGTIFSPIYLLDKYLLNTYYVPHIVLGTRNTEMNKADKIFTFMELAF